jgi:hypothetical protein
MENGSADARRGTSSAVARYLSVCTGSIVLKSFYGIRRHGPLDCGNLATPA